jgi:hypothetical protein
MTRQPRCLHHTCCAPYRSTTSRENCGNAGTYSRLRPRPPEKHRHSTNGMLSPIDYERACARSKCANEDAA